MNPELEKLIELFAQAQQCDAKEQDVKIATFRQACAPYAGQAGGDAGKVGRFVKRAYYLMRAADNKRVGRPPGLGA
ncbi:MAG: hypothetical protein LBM04_09155 [Opitutaceae bacterium]|jgi:hypothetical protein|nr:hypothetical protein [Opitutaceae bacterium]